jgi:glyoxylase-like metal-dependent hydrolase (beta-lactamase superfamily II)
VLFDTGQDRASVTDPDYFPGGLNGVVYDRLARFDIGPDQTLARGLAALGHRPSDVHTAVISHLHQDHLGGLPELPDARIVVSEREWESVRRPLAATTPGHTPGSLSMLVRRPGRAPFLLVGDLTYDAGLLAAGEIPGVGNKPQLPRAVAAVNTLRQRLPGLTVLAAHDPGAASLLAAATAPVAAA